jgi:hypothetical protein
MNNFITLTKYMTEESEHYTVRPKVHKSPVTLLDLEPGKKYNITEDLVYLDHSLRCTPLQQSTSQDFS